MKMESFTHFQVDCTRYWRGYWLNSLDRFLLMQAAPLRYARPGPTPPTEGRAVQREANSGAQLNIDARPLLCCYRKRGYIIILCMLMLFYTLPWNQKWLWPNWFGFSKQLLILYCVIFALFGQLSLVTLSCFELSTSGAAGWCEETPSSQQPAAPVLLPWPVVPTLSDW